MNHLLFSQDQIACYETSGKFVCKEGGTFHPHRILDSFVLLLGSSGEYTISEGGQEYCLVPGSFLLLFPGNEHFGTTPATPGLSHYWCHFRLPSYEASATPRSLRSNGLQLPTFGHAAAPERVRMLFHQLIDYARREGAYRDRTCDLALTLLLTELAGNVSIPSLTSHSAAMAARVSEWICLYIGEIASARDVAEHFGYNCEYLTTALRHVTGKTLSEHIREARIEEAKNLLLCSNLTVKEIAYRCGFSDEKYFQRVFRALTDTTPGLYRNTFVHMHYNKS